MKQTLMNMMTALMPFMKPLVWLTGLSLLAGLALALIGGTGWRRGASVAAWIVLSAGIFFLAAQGMGALLGAAPSINLGDARQGEFFLVPFWQLGLAALVGGAVLRLLVRLKRRREGSS